MNIPRFFISQIKGASENYDVQKKKELIIIDATVIGEMASTIRSGKFEGREEEYSFVSRALLSIRRRFVTKLDGLRYNVKRQKQFRSSLVIFSRVSHQLA